jgi:D-alanyl-D-alanine endopeptidase (penicillin-binding protein 7)
MALFGIRYVANGQVEIVNRKIGDYVSEITGRVLSMGLIACLLLTIAVGTPRAAVTELPKKDLALASVSVLATDLNTGTTLVAKHPDAVLPIASITKVMTALVVLDSGEPLNAWLPIENWGADPSKNAYSRIRISSEARREDLLQIALMSSENRAAYNLAVHHPGGIDAFVKTMNAKAQSLGMTNTVFVDPMGLSPENRSTAHDLTRMVAAAYEQNFIREYSTTRQHTVRFQSPRYQLGYGNTNPLTGSSRWDVLLTKTGYLTEAGRCLVMVTKAGGKDIAMVLLNSFGKRTPLGDAGRIRRWLESGTQSTVASAARAYENRMVKAYGLD